MQRQLCNSIIRSTYIWMKRSLTPFSVFNALINVPVMAGMIRFCIAILGPRFNLYSDVKSIAI